MSKKMILADMIADNKPPYIHWELRTLRGKPLVVSAKKYRSRKKVADDFMDVFQVEQLSSIRDNLQMIIDGRASLHDMVSVLQETLGIVELVRNRIDTSRIHYQ